MKKNDYSERVTNFATSTLKKMLVLQGYGNVNDSVLKVIVNSCEFKKINQKIITYSQIKHAGKYGRLEKISQNKLNLLLLAYDLVGKNKKDKRMLVLRHIKKNDNYLKKKKEKKIESNLIKEMIKEIDDYDYKFKSFIIKIDTLFLIRKYELKKIIKDDKKYQSCIAEISKIFAKHIAIAIALQNDKLLKN